MKAKKCDRCGEFYTDYEQTPERGNANTVQTVMVAPITGQGKVKDTFDLCPGCMEKQMLFLKNEPIEEDPADPSTEPTDPSNEPSDPNTDPTAGTTTDPSTEPGEPPTGNEPQGGTE